MVEPAPFLFKVGSTGGTVRGSVGVGNGGRLLGKETHALARKKWMQPEDI